MRDLVNQRATYVFAALVAITLVGYWLTAGHGGAAIGDTGGALWASVVVLVYVKVRWVLLDFMELRNAPWTLRAAFELWALGVCISLIVINAAVG